MQPVARLRLQDAPAGEVDASPAGAGGGAREGAMYEVDIVDEPARRVVGLEHRGAYSAIGPTFGRLMQVVRDQGLQGEMMEPKSGGWRLI